MQCDGNLWTEHVMFTCKSDFLTSLYSIFVLGIITKIVILWYKYNIANLRLPIHYSNNGTYDAKDIPTAKTS